MTTDTLRNSCTSVDAQFAKLSALPPVLSPTLALSSFTCLNRRHISCAQSDPHIDHLYSYLGLGKPSGYCKNDIWKEGDKKLRHKHR